MMRSLRMFVCGVTGSGKSDCIRKIILPKWSRSLVIDPVGDYAEASGIDSGFSVGEIADAIRGHMMRGDRSWHVIGSIGRDEIGELTDFLLPPGRIRSSFVRSLGGMLLVLEEADILTPRGQHGELISSLFRRGRHVGLSVVSATQRPVNIAKEVTSQAEIRIVYRIHDTRDLRWIRDSIPGLDRLGPLVWSRPFAAVYHRTGEIPGVLTPDYRVIRLSEQALDATG